MVEVLAGALTASGIAFLVVTALASMRVAGEDDAPRQQLLIGLGGALLVAGAVAQLLDHTAAPSAARAALVVLRGLLGVGVLALASAVGSTPLRAAALAAGLAAALLAVILAVAA